MNEDRLAEVMRYVTEHPEQHDQGTWLAVDTSCGTVACLAGWTCLLNGYEPRYDDLWDMPHPAGGTELNWVGRFGRPDERLDVLQTAAELLGVSLGDEDQADLFHGDHTLRTLWRLVEELTEGRVRRP